jgi:hypothetical protein
MKPLGTSRANSSEPAAIPKMRAWHVAAILVAFLIFFYFWAYVWMAEKTYYCEPVWRIPGKRYFRVERLYTEMWKHTFFAPAAWIESRVRGMQVHLVRDDPEIPSPFPPDNYNVDRREPGWP